jgi:Kdo2-lipid IVA lauroyltransferase/acyltransferase
VAAANIELCFPGLDALAKRRLLALHLESVGLGMVETAMTWFRSDRELRELCHVEGLEHIERARRGGRGVILLTGHFTTMELALHGLGVHVPLHGMYRPLKNAVFEHLVTRTRAARAAGMFTREDPRAMLRALRDNAAVCYAPDQNYGRRHSVFVPFFGVPTATITTTARMARASRAPVIPYLPRRLPVDGGYLVEVGPALEDFPSGDDEADARRINALIEDGVRRAPEQYLWMHRRFKVRPEGMPDPYQGTVAWC